MASNIKNFKFLIHFNETRRGFILSEDLTYSMLHEMVMQKFNLEANADINFSFKLSSFDFAVDITDDAEDGQAGEGSRGGGRESQQGHGRRERGHNGGGPTRSRGSKLSTVEFRLAEAHELQQTPVYNAKPNISKQYTQQSEVEKEQKNEGTVTRIKTDDKGVFEMLFIAIGASIRTFLNYLRPMLMIDAAHLKGVYKGTNLVVVAMDGNNQIVPIAFGICKGETGPCWSWWMSVLKECIGDNPNLLFISDRHLAIAMAVENEFPLAFHVVCCRYLMQNLSLKNKTKKSLMLQKALVELGLKYGPRRACPIVRYNYMTSNSVESVNACSVIYRKEPVLKLAETYRAMVQEWYYKRRQLAANMTYEITDWAAHKVAKKRMKSATWVVKGVNEYQYQVSDDWFKKPKYQGTYSESIHFLGNMQQWEFPHNIQKAIPPRMDNPQPGRPKNTNRIQSQGEEPRVIHCSRCKQAGHKRDQCSQPFVVQPPVNIRTQNDQEIPRNNQPSFYNPTQHYDNTFHNINHYTSQQYGATTYPSQPYCETPYPSQPYDQHFTNTSQAYNGHHTESSQMYEQYNSQQYDAQHLDDLNTNGSNSWFNSFGF
ncbi:transposase, MuDR, MULE transposase domain protein [Tanacetum coccineum]